MTTPDPGGDVKSSAGSPGWGRGRRAGAVVTALIIAVVVVAAGLAQTSVGHSVFSSLGIRTGREPYTALAFPNPADVGDYGIRYSGDHVRDTVKFRILDREHRAMNYRWTISFSPSTRKYSGRTLVAAGAQAVVRTTVTLPCGEASAGKPKRVQVRVALAQRHESIDYWRSCGD